MVVEDHADHAPVGASELLYDLFEASKMARCSRRTGNEAGTCDRRGHLQRWH
jgi:hypothetical protein